MNRVGEVASTLATIPLLPALVDLAVQDPLASVTSCQELSQRKDNVSLLDWLHLRNSNDSFHKLSQMCSRGIQQVGDSQQCWDNHVTLFLYKTLPLSLGGDFLCFDFSIYFYDVGALYWRTNNNGNCPKIHIYTSHWKSKKKKRKEFS